MAKERTYEFSMKGWEKAHADAFSDKIGKYTNIVVWGVIVTLAINGVISHQGIIKMFACSGTSKVVKFLIHL
jgi:hypothetical protein